VDEFEQTMFANKVAQIVISSLAPASEPVSDKVKEKLKERGIKPDNSPHHP
jgi:methylmalonyl-CoA mutase cobalamin-binding subunit